MESSPASNSEVATIKLACQACQRKKIKCDRFYPCGQCNKAGLTCVPSARRPRTRHAGKRAGLDSELRSRISKLESLVETLSGEVGAPPVSSLGQDEEVTEAPNAQADGSPEPVTTKYNMGAHFWAALTDEVQALRDAIDEDEFEQTPSTEPSPSVAAGPDAASSADLLICPPGAIFVMPGALPEPAPEIESQLYIIFFKNIDPVFKILHAPTVQSFLHFGNDYLGLSADAPPNRALKAAMWFASTTSLNDSECQSRLGFARAELLSQFRRHCDLTLAQADLINTQSLATLQAAVTYVAASRLSDASRRPWTMTALVVRIAQGMGLDNEDPNSTPFDREQRRRLWHQIRVLDAFSSIDRGSQVLISYSAMPAPTNANDDDFNESSTSIPQRESGVTDMTFTMMTHSGANLNAALLSPGSDTWQRRFESTQGFSKEIHEKYMRFCDPSKPYERFLLAVGRSMVTSSILRAVRPMQKLVGSVPPRVDSPFVLQLAVNTLHANAAIHEDPEAEGWRWIFWIQWHALAVALAGLCSIRDTELAQTAWELVEKAYERYSGGIADTRTGMLWRPIEKLYKKAQAFRDHTGTSPPNTTDSPALMNMTNRMTSPVMTSSSQANIQTSTAATTTTTTQQLPLPQLIDGNFSGSWLTDPSPGLDFSFAPVDDLSTDMSSLNTGNLAWDWDKIMQDISTMPTSLGFSDMDLMTQDTSLEMAGAVNSASVPPDLHGGWKFGG